MVPAALKWLGKGINCHAAFIFDMPDEHPSDEAFRIAKIACQKSKVVLGPHMKAGLLIGSSAVGTRLPKGDIDLVIVVDPKARVPKNLPDPYLPHEIEGMTIDIFFIDKKIFEELPKHLPGNTSEGYGTSWAITNGARIIYSDHDYAEKCRATLSSIKPHFNHRLTQFRRWVKSGEFKKRRELRKKWKPKP